MDLLSSLKALDDYPPGAAFCVPGPFESYGFRLECGLSKSTAQQLG